MKKPTSPKQIAANRRNALKSTGPRTREGRAASGMNSLKHGILSTQVLVRSAFYEESEEEFKALHRRFTQDLQPHGPVEEMLVDQIVTAHWRLRRVLRAEAGEVELSVDSASRWRADSFNPLTYWTRWLAFGEPALAMAESSLGNAVLADWLSEIRDEVEKNGGLTESSIRLLEKRLRGKPCGLVDQLEAFRRQMDAAAPESLSPAQRKAQTIEFLQGHIQRCKSARELLSVSEAREDESRREAALIPSPKKLDKILRYETKLERQLYRAMLQLERIQRFRNGDSVPAPLSVHIADRS